MSNRDGDDEIYLMDPDGTNVEQLTDNDAVDSTPAWSKDGNSIAFASDRDGGAEIFIMRADGTRRTQLTDSPDTEVNAWPRSSTAARSSSRTRPRRARRSRQSGRHGPP